MQPSMARALDIGGMVWEGKSHYSSIDELFRDMEAGLSAWLDQTKQPYKPKAKVKRTRKKLR
jgi:hypothetical protein